MARLPRLRRPRLRRRPINAAADPRTEAPTEEAPTEVKPAEPAGGEPEEPRPRRRWRPRRPRPSRRAKLAGGAALLLGAGVVAAAAAGLFESDEDPPPAPVAPPPQPAETTPSEERPVAEAAAQLGFPVFATKNTTRVGGATPTADAAGVALATFPSAGGVEPPRAVALAGEDDLAGALAAAVLMAEPLRVPLLLSTPDELPEESEQALAALAPEGGAETRGAQLLAIGDVEAPDGLKVTRVGAGGPAALAAAIDRLRGELTGIEPEHVVVAPLANPAFAMPAAAWAARSGDPVLFAAADSLPKATAKALQRHRDARVYVLGPSSAISSRVVRQISRAADGAVRRVSGEDPVSNAIEFARYADGNFGWNINDPGHGFVLASSGRPLDAAAAAPLSASGTWGPLLLTDSADTLPGALRGYLLDVKPGYRSDPTRAFYNHIWIIGDQEAIDVSQQAAVDDLAELARIGGKPEREPTRDGGGGGSS